MVAGLRTSNFYPRSPCGERHNGHETAPYIVRFLSTLSLRRATVGQKRLRQKLAISIHALLAESDRQSWRKPHGQKKFLSTLSLRRATFRAVKISCAWSISIHALLAESDLAGPSGPAFLFNFYPRSPCGERPIVNNIVLMPREFLSTLSLRRATTSEVSERVPLAISIHALLAESD